MLRLILSNRWLALLWMALVALSAARFAGKDGQGITAIDKAASQVAARKGEQAQPPQEAESPVVVEEPAERLPGEGYDPTPKEAAPAN